MAILLGENDRVRDYLKLVVADLSDEQVKYGHVAVDDRPIGAIVQHIYGSMAFIAQVVRAGGMPDSGRPVPSAPPDSRDAVLVLIDRLHEQVTELWRGLTDEQLSQDVSLPWRGTTTGYGALLGAVAHAHRHIGNIIDARCLGGFQTRALG